MSKGDMQKQWIWQQPQWPVFSWDPVKFAPILRGINQLQGKLLGSAEVIDETGNSDIWSYWQANRAFRSAAASRAGG